MKVGTYNHIHTRKVKKKNDQIRIAELFEERKKDRRRRRRYSIRRYEFIIHLWSVTG